MSAARRRRQGWPQATAGGGAQRPWRRRARCERCWSGRRSRDIDGGCEPGLGRVQACGKDHITLYPVGRNGPEP